MIKVSHVIGNLGYGGAEKLLLDICRKIDKDNFEIDVMALYRNSDNPLGKQFEDAGIKVEYFNKKNKFDISVLNKMEEFLRTTAPDIVHTHLFGGDFWGASAARSAGVEHVVCTKHDIMSEGYVRDSLGRRSRREMEKIVAISNATREFLIKKEKISIDKIQVIYNGIDVSRFYIENPGVLQKEGLVIGCVGRLSKEKGQKHLLRACRFIKNKDWRLILVGDGPMREELENLAKLLGIENQVVFTGSVSDVRPYLAQMDVFVLPSISEGLSLAVLEAACSGRFVIATNVGGVPEIIDSKENGFLFKPKNIEQLVTHLNWVDDNREDAIRMAEKLQDFVCDKFDINKTISEYERLYYSLMNK